jgi:ribose-phosphate pyrophosphokinase
MIVGGPASQLLAGRVAAILGEELALCDYRVFPDGESYTRVVTDLEDEVVVIQSTPTDRDIIHLLQLLDVCRDRKVSLVIPYFGYARQDKIFNPGEPMTARAIASALNPFLEDGRVWLVNIHARSILSHFTCKAEHLDATHLLADKVSSMGLEDPVVIAPDKGALSMAEAAAARLKAEHDQLEKTRQSGTEVSMAPGRIDARGRDVVIFDDIISTGGTMATAVSMLRAQGARRVILAAVHPVLAGNALLKLYRSGVDAVIATDTLEKAVSTVSVAPLIAESVV